MDPCVEFRYESLPSRKWIWLLRLQPLLAVSEGERFGYTWGIRLSPVAKMILPSNTLPCHTCGEAQTTVEQSFSTASPSRVTFDLFCALHNVRHANIELVLRADVICINRNDFKERGEPVNMMGMIYSTARHTVIYFGESNEDSEKTVRALRRLRVAPLDDPSIQVLTSSTRSTLSPPPPNCPSSSGQPQLYRLTARAWAVLPIPMAHSSAAL